MPMPLSFKQRIAKAIVFFVSSLVILSLIRVVFFATYKTPEITFAEFLPAAWMGVRVDAKWLATLAVPAWLLLCLSAWRYVFWRLAVWMAGLATAIAVTVAVVNFGFYDFYRTPISPIIFGLFQDDTTAIVKTLQSDWPIFQYLSSLIVLIAVPLALGRIVFNGEEPSSPQSKTKIIVAVLVGTVLLGGMIRGSFGTFPLRQQNFAVTNNAFVNATVPGGLASLYEAWKGQKVLELKGDPKVALTALGFKSLEEAQAVLDTARKDVPAVAQSMKTKPNVVVAIMESMGRDTFDLHSESCNTLGSLADELSDAVVFRNGISVNSGTFPSLEGILFDSPLTPLTQSRYGRKTFDFSKVNDFKKEGYKTVFLSAGNESWRQVDVNFPLQGFDEIIGANAIQKRYPQVKISTWGLGDAWMFKAATEILKENNDKQQPVLLVLLSVTNHPPHEVPSDVELASIEEVVYPHFVEDDRKELLESMAKTYQYASDSLGKFVREVRKDTGARESIIVATGDQNARLRYKSQGYWHHANGVPIIFWLPESLKQIAGEDNVVDANRWVSHRDIFPTLEGLAFGKQAQNYEGRNLFSGETFDVASAYAGMGKYGWAIGSWGAVSLDGSEKLSCYRWREDLLESTECSETMEQNGKAARAQRAIVEYMIRSWAIKTD